jgi:hypothetical protein
VFEGMPEANGYKQRKLLPAMNRLLTEKRIKMAQAASKKERPRSWLERV